MTFVATACDGGTTTVKKKRVAKPDGFGMAIQDVTLPGATDPLRVGVGLVAIN